MNDVSKKLSKLKIWNYLAGIIKNVQPDSVGVNKNKISFEIYRFMAGIGYGLDGAIMGTLTRTANPNNRSTIIARTILLR